MKKTLLFVIVAFLVIPFSLLRAQDDVWYTTILKEKFLDKNGNPLTGKGVVVGDVDSGIDIFSPFFFFADGGEYSWVDVNKDGEFTPGVDAVDFNKNGKADTDEILNFIGMKNVTYGVLKFKSKEYKADMDFLYQDKNKNSKRDFSEKDGFTENDPTYGEQLFICLDKNKDNKLSSGEKLIALKTSKVRAVREKDGTIRRRGIDLIKTEPDTIKHGTSVCGLVLGGQYGIQKMCGIAPDAEIVMANINYDYTPRFVRNFPDMIRFLKDEKINVLLFEDGEWMYEFNDGSTEEEELANQIARDGITVIGGGGNLSSGNMHIKDNIKAEKWNTYTFVSPKEAEGKKNDGVFVSMLWTDKNAKIVFTVETPDGKKSPELTDGSGFITIGDYHLFYSRDVSEKGTVMFRFGFSQKDSGTVDGDWKLNVKSPNDLTIDGFLVDVTQSWAGSTHWTSKDKITDEGTITFPSTADSLIAVGAYTVNFAFGPGDKLGDLCTYSGRGYNINGKMGIDICAPGHCTFTVSTDNSYTLFSGTSSAAPHVVGTVVLMLQYDPTLTHSQVRNILKATATSDEFTGNLPNTNWGFGKLNPESAIKYLMK
ncbi:MAG: S8 family serine peptidase, partial [Ignavibacteria bacterium]|jgi:subtilisin family serine protease